MYHSLPEGLAAPLPNAVSPAPFRQSGFIAEFAEGE